MYCFIIRTHSDVTSSLHRHFYQACNFVDFIHSYILLLHHRILFRYCFTVIACAILTHTVHTAWVWSTHAIFTMCSTAMLCGFQAFIGCRHCDLNFSHISHGLQNNQVTHVLCVSWTMRGDQCPKLSADVTSHLHSSLSLRCCRSHPFWVHCVY